MVRTISKRKIRTYESFERDKDGTVLNHEIGHIYFVKDLNKKYTIMFSHFAKVFSELQHNESKVMIWLADNAAYNDPVMIVNKTIREKIALDMKISKYSVMPTMTALVKKGFVQRLGTERSCTYQINPKYFWRGDISSRNDKLKPMLIEQ